jgi:hypothetical protein
LFSGRPRPGLWRRYSPPAATVRTAFPRSRHPERGPQFYCTQSRHTHSLDFHLLCSLPTRTLPARVQGQYKFDTGTV